MAFQMILHTCLPSLFETVPLQPEPSLIFIAVETKIIDRSTKYQSKASNAFETEKKRVPVAAAACRVAVWSTRVTCLLLLWEVQTVASLDSILTYTAVWDLRIFIQVVSKCTDQLNLAAAFKIRCGTMSLKKALAFVSRHSTLSASHRDLGRNCSRRSIFYRIYLLV